MGKGKRCCDHCANALDVEQGYYKVVRFAGYVTRLYCKECQKWTRTVDYTKRIMFIQEGKP